MTIKLSSHSAYQCWEMCWIMSRRYSSRHLLPVSIHSVNQEQGDEIILCYSTHCINNYRSDENCLFYVGERNAYCVPTLGEKHTYTDLNGNEKTVAAVVECGCSTGWNFFVSRRHRTMTVFTLHSHYTVQHPFISVIAYYDHHDTNN